MLAVASVHGSSVDMNKYISLMANCNVPMSVYTYNILLDRCAADGNVTLGLQILQDMKDIHIEPDRTTYNTLLKLCITAKNTSAFDEVEMRTIIYNMNTHSYIYIMYL